MNALFFKVEPFCGRERGFSRAGARRRSPERSRRIFFEAFSRRPSPEPKSWTREAGEGSFLEASRKPKPLQVPEQRGIETYGSKQSVSDAIKDKNDKGGPAEKPHDERPVEQRANQFRDTVEKERKQYREQQKQEEKQRKEQQRQQKQRKE